jgi:hypothetical protein
MKISVKKFEQLLPKCRSRETTAEPEGRSDNNPSYRQCLVTALLANEFLWLPIYSEKIIFEDNRIRKHYFNGYRKHEYKHFCAEQFVYETKHTRTNTKLKTKERIATIKENYPSIHQRYEILKKRLQEEITSTIS